MSQAMGLKHVDHLTMGPVVPPEEDPELPEVPLLEESPELPDGLPELLGTSVPEEFPRFPEV
jgi:hypothetical protein